MVTSGDLLFPAKTYTPLGGFFGAFFALVGSVLFLGLESKGVEACLPRSQRAQAWA